MRKSNVDYFLHLTDINVDELYADITKIANEHVKWCIESLKLKLKPFFFNERFPPEDNKKGEEFVEEALKVIVQDIYLRVKNSFGDFENFVSEKVFTVKRLDTDKYSIDSMVGQLAKLKKENQIAEMLVIANQRVNQKKKAELFGVRKELEDYVEKVDIFNNLLHTYLDFVAEYGEGNHPTIMSENLEKYNKPLEEIDHVDKKDVKKDEIIIPLDLNGCSLNAFDFIPMIDGEESNRDVDDFL